MRFTQANKIRLLYFLVLSCTASWLPIFADYLKERGLDGLEIASILSITPVMIFTVQPFYGMLADKIGYRSTLIVSSLLTSVSFALFLVEGGFMWLFIVTIAMSLFYNTVQPILDSLSLAEVAKNNSINYGSIRIAGALGWAITGTTVGFFINSTDTRVIFAWASISMLLTLIVALMLSNKEEDSRVPTEVMIHQNLITVFTNRSLLFLLLCVFLVSTGATTIWNFYSIYMKENGADSQLVGFGLSLQGLCELPLFYFSARIIRKLGIKTTLVFTITATAARLCLYSLITNPYAALLIELLHGISWSLFWVACVECVNKIVIERWRVTGQSLLYASYFGAGAVAGNFWTGYLYERNISISQIFLLNALIVAVVAVAMLVFFRKSSK